MLSASRRQGGLSRVRLMASVGVGALCAIPLSIFLAPAAEAQAAKTEQVEVIGNPDYKIDTPNLAKITTPLVDTPQSINEISQQEMEDRGVANFNDAIRTVPGITIGAGEFRSTGNTPTIRGFVARTDIFLDGLRDFGDYYRDPFNLQQIEVLKGPASVLFGRGSTGGVINQVSKTPELSPFVGANLTLGTDLTRRAVVDVNEPLADLGPDAAFRVTAMGHEQNVEGRDDVTSSRYGFAPSLSIGIGTPTRFNISYFHLSTDDVPDYGLPYFGSTPADVPRENFYGFKSDFMKTTTDIGTFTAEHDFNDAITVRNQVRYADYYRNFRFTEPLIATTVPLTTPLTSVNVTRNVNAGNSDDWMLWDQADATFKFDTGFIKHTLVVGIEGGREKATPKFDNFTGVPTTPLLDPNDNQLFTATSQFPRFQTDADADSFGAYALDTLKLGSQWEFTGALRWDYFRLDYNDVNFSTTTPGLVTRQDHIPRTDEMPSYRAALVYKPVDIGSIYVAYGTSFNPSGEELSFVTSSRSFTTSNEFLAPEKNRTYELGTKWDLFNDHLAVNGAVFRLEKYNARVPDPTNSLLNLLAGSERVDGFELSTTGRITDKWQITGGYTYLDSRMTKSATGAAPVGSPLMNTPKNNLTLWTTYSITHKIEVGAGARYVSSQETQNVPPIKTVPGFTTADLMAKYAISDRLSLQLNINNLFDKYYYDQLHFFHVVPGEGRTALLSLNAAY